MSRIVTVMMRFCNLSELGHKEKRQRQRVDVVLEGVSDDVPEAGYRGAAGVEGIA